MVEPPSAYGTPQRTPVWLPDGSGIIFGQYGKLSLNVGNSAYPNGQPYFFEYLYLVSADGSALHRISVPPPDDDWYGDFSPSMSADGSRIAFTTSRHESGLIFKSRDLEIGTSAPDGSEYRRLTDRKGEDTNPVWSPDGSRIAFSSDESVVTMDPDGSDMRRITPPSNNMKLRRNPPVWSPDGLRFALLVSGHLRTESKKTPKYVTVLYTVAVDGTDWQRISETHVQPSWSPDGTRIAFAVQQPGEDYTWKVYTARSDGSDLRDLYPSRRYYDLSNISWSPDGSEIRFSGARYYVGEKDERYAVGVYALQADGSSTRIIAVAPTGSSWTMSWSPDDSRIAFRLFDRLEALYTLASDGSDKRVLVQEINGRLVPVSAEVSNAFYDIATGWEDVMAFDLQRYPVQVTDVEKSMSDEIDLPVEALAKGWTSTIFFGYWSEDWANHHPQKAQLLIPDNERFEGRVHSNSAELLSCDDQPNQLGPRELVNLTNLRSLDLAHTRLIDNIPAEIRRCTDVNCLDMTQMCLVMTDVKTMPEGEVTRVRVSQKTFRQVRQPESSLEVILSVSLITRNFVKSMQQVAL